MISKTFKNLLRTSQLLNKPAYKFGGGGFQKIVASRNDATSVFTESVQNMAVGLKTTNHIEEHDETLTEEQKKGLKRFLIYRFDPSDPNDEPKYKSYWVDIKKFPPMFLDAILYIKDNLDASLSIRRSCREGICGSCAVNCDGLHTLACIKGFDRDLSKPTIITPMGHMFVLKDLVVDMTQFYTQYKRIDPYLRRKTPKPAEWKEFRQSPEERKMLDGLYECVLCASCTTSCPSYWWHADKYMGPAILQQAYRWVVDSRDEYTEERIQMIAEDVRIDDCQQIGMCTLTCPKGLNPQQSLGELIKMVKSYKDKKAVAESL